MPDEGTDCQCSKGLRPPKLNIDCVPTYNFETDSPTSDILLNAVAPQDKENHHSTLVQTEDGTCILCDSPQPDYTLVDARAESPNKDSLASDRSSSSASSHTLMTERINPSTDAEQPQDTVTTQRPPKCRPTTFHYLREASKAPHHHMQIKNADELLTNDMKKPREWSLGKLLAISPWQTLLALAAWVKSSWLCITSPMKR